MAGETVGSTSRHSRWPRSCLWMLSLAALALLFFAPSSDAQQRRGREVPVKPLPTKPAPKGAADTAAAKAAETALPPAPVETLQADVSTRNVAVTSSFTGTEIVVFGAIDNSQQTSPEAGLYDVVVIVEGVPSKVTARRKTKVGGIWLNTSSTTFDSVPTYYAIASTRPLDELAAEATLIGYEIGFDHVRMTPTGGVRLPPTEMAEFRKAVVRIKEKDGLYVSAPHGVAFIGRSLFRSTIALPANVSVGPFETRIYLFKGERLISQYELKLNLERDGLERFLHDFAFNKPFLYGIATVILALMSGLIANAVFSKGSH